MISWASPWVLVFLVPVALLALRGRLVGTNRLAVARIGAMQRRPSLRLLLAWLPPALQMAGLACLVVALARPQITRHDTIVESHGLDIILAVDTSGSMRADDFTIGVRPVDRLEVAKGVMAEFIRGRPHDRVGVVVFGEEAFTFVPLTLDHQGLLSILQDVQIGIAGAQGTAVGTALAVSAKRLKDLDAPEKIVILLTDGRSNAGRISPLEAAQAAAALGIRVYTIGVGAERRTLFLSAYGDGLDEKGLTQIAELTGGRFFRATDSDSLQKIYDTIDELEPSPAEVRQLVSHEERFRPWLLSGLGLLALQLALGGTWLRRGP